MFCQRVCVCQWRVRVSQPAVWRTWQLSGWFRWGQYIMMQPKPCFLLTVYISSMVRSCLTSHWSFKTWDIQWESITEKDNNCWFMVFLCLQIGCVKECREDEFLCLNRAHCIPRRWRCDDVFDCMDHSDEENCRQGRLQCVLVRFVFTVVRHF